MNETGGAAILGSYTWSQDSILWQSLSDDVALKLAVDNVDMLHKDIDIRPFYKGGKTKHWCNDLYSHGAFVLFTPYQELYIKEALKQSVGNVHFIGEHTSSAHGWIEGSILSALRIALVIQEEFFDVAIIGGGPIGLATAINLANRNSALRIVVIDQSHIGNSEGSSGSSDTRQFRQMYDEQYLAELAMTASNFWGQLELDANLTKGTLLNTDQGYLFFGDHEMGETTEGDLKDIEQNCQTLSMGCQMLDSADLQRRFPFFHIPPTYKGVFHQNSGYINVTALMNALEKLAMKKNIMIRTGETFLELDQSIPETASYVRLFTDRGSLNAMKVIFAPGPFARNVSEKLGFTLHMTMWELPTIYFPLRITNYTIPTWFAFGGDKQSLFYGFSKESSDRPGYVKISPDFITDMSNPLIYPNDRKNAPDQRLINKTKDWVRTHVQLVDPDSPEVAPSTCLATFLPDNGFLIDYLPDTIRYHNKLIMYAAGWGMKFVPLWADVLAELALNPQSSKYAKYKDKFSFQPGRWSPNNVVPSSARHITMPNKMLLAFSTLCVILMIMLFAN
jgi:glycine/D-amino acid oxidase-like deaminating enzyme